MFGSVRRRTKQDKYRANGRAPAVYLDFVRRAYRKNGSRVARLSDIATYSATTPSSMRDADGILKWAPHNLLTRSEDFSAGDWTLDNSGGSLPIKTPNYGLAPDGTMTACRVQLDKTGGTYARIQNNTGLNTITQADYTGQVWIRTTSGGTSNVGLRLFDNGINVVVTGTWQLFSHEILNTTDTGFQVLLFDSIVGNDETADILIWKPRVFRSDLGGMAINHETSSTYVPTVASAVFMPRVGHHRFNGVKWVNKGLLLESEARTNLRLWSNDFNNAAHTKQGVTIGTPTAIGPDGNASLNRITITAATSNHRIYNTAPLTAVSNSPTCVSCFVRYNTQRYVSLVSWRSSQVWSCVVFDLQTLTITKQENGLTSGIINMANAVNMGGGLIYLYLVSTQSGTSFYPVLQAHSGPTPTLAASDAVESYLGAGQILDAGFCMDEVGNVPSSYIPTTTVGVARSAETMTVGSANMAYNASGLSFAIEGEYNIIDNNISNPGWVGGRWGSGSDHIEIRWQQVSDVAGFSAISTGQTNRYIEQAFTTYGLNVPVSISGRLTATQARSAVSGVLGPQNSTAATIANLTSANFTISNTAMGTMAYFRQWNSDIEDAGIQQASQGV